MQLVFRLIEETGIPHGVVNLVNGSKDAVDAILDHPEIRAVTFVGSTPTAKYVYSRAAGQWEARSSTSRSQESGGSACRRRYGDGHKDRRRLGIWVRRTALPGGFLGFHSRGSAGRLYRYDLRSGRLPESSGAARIRALRWAL